MTLTKSDGVYVYEWGDDNGVDVKIAGWKELFHDNPPEFVLRNIAK